MGIFSFFKRRRTTAASEADDLLQSALPPPARQRAPAGADKEAALRDIARATALKIDAIEAAMSFDIFHAPEPPWSRRPPRRAAGDSPAPSPDEQWQPAPSPMAAPIEEIAMAYARQELETVEQNLQAALRAQPRAAGTRGCWSMLLDFYQITGNAAQFDNLAIDYASTFETFPPLWSNSRYRIAGETGAPSYTGVMPTLALPAIVDGTINAQCDRLAQLAIAHPIIRIEFVAVTQADAAGCQALIGLLKNLQQSQRELILVGAAEMCRLLRSQVRIGRRDADAPWILLLEILKLSQREKDYRETSVDYRVTYNVSAQPYEKPGAVFLADAQNRQTPGSPDRFMMPVVVSPQACPALLEKIAAYASRTAIVVLDCSRLARVDFEAAATLLAGLQALAGAGKTIELHDVNHLVATLLGILHFNEISKILHHRY